MEKIIFHSYKGGAGKSLFSINVGRILANQGKNVLVIESDFDMPIFKEDKQLGKLEPKYFLNEYLSQDDPSLLNYIYNVFPNFDVIYSFPNFELDPTLAVNPVLEKRDQWYFNKLIQLDTGIQQLGYDYIIFDIQPGISYFSVNLAIFTDKIFLMARPDEYSIYSTINLYEKFYSKYNIFEDKYLYIVMNQIPNIDQIETFNQYEELADFKKTMYQWEIEIKSRITTMNQLFFVYLDYYTMIHLTTNGIILPPNKGINIQLKKIVSSIF